MKSRSKKFSKQGEFRSKLESVIAKRLPKGTKFESEKLKYFIPKNYLPDFVIVTPKGKKIYLEVKGYLRYEDQQKMRAVKMCNPDLDIRFYFPKDNRVQSSNMLNSEWCKKYSFDYAIGTIPRGWFK